MTPVVEIEQRFQNVTQVDRRTNHRWCRLLMSSNILESEKKPTHPAQQSHTTLIQFVPRIFFPAQVLPHTISPATPSRYVRQ